MVVPSPVTAQTSKQLWIKPFLRHHRVCTIDILYDMCMQHSSSLSLSPLPLQNNACRWLELRPSLSALPFLFLCIRKCHNPNSEFSGTWVPPAGGTENSVPLLAQEATVMCEMWLWFSSSHPHLLGLIRVPCLMLQTPFVPCPLLGPKFPCQCPYQREQILFPQFQTHFKDC